MVSPLLLRTVAVSIYPKPQEIRVKLYAIGPDALLDHERERERIKKK